MKANVQLAVAVEMVGLGKWTAESFQGPHRSSPVLCRGAMCAPRRYTLLPTQSNDVIKTARNKDSTPLPHARPYVGCADRRAAPDRAAPLLSAQRHRRAASQKPAKPALASECAVRVSPETSKPSLQRTGRNSKLVRLERRIFGEVRTAHRQLVKTLQRQLPTMLPS